MKQNPALQDKVLRCARDLFSKFEYEYRGTDMILGISPRAVQTIYYEHFKSDLSEAQGDLFICFIDNRGSEFYNRDMTFALADVLLLMLDLSPQVGTVQ